MLMIRLYANSLEGMIHIDDGCWHTRRSLAGDPPPGYEWDGAESTEAADAKYPDHALYWCGLRACFGPDNPRRYPR